MASNRNSPRLLMMPQPAARNEQGQILGLECLQIDLITGTKTLTTFSPNTSCDVNHLFVDGHACFSHGPLVLIVGGYSTSVIGGIHIFNTTSVIGGIHIFNTATGQWTPGPNLLFPRGSFAWGVIGNRLYIAGGIGPSGTVKESEVYDLETGELWAVAALPVSMAVDVFFVFSGKLRVRGWVRGHGRGSPEWTFKCLCYCPDKNVWQNDSWLQKVVKRVPRMTRSKFAVTSDNELYRAELKEEVFNRNPGPGSVFIYKLDKGNFQWEKIFLTIDSEVRDQCKCPVVAEREVRFFACREKVLLLMHHDDPDEGEVTPLAHDITEVSFLCPFQWASAAILYA